MATNPFNLNKNDETSTNLKDFTQNPIHKQIYDLLLADSKRDMIQVLTDNFVTKTQSLAPSQSLSDRQIRDISDYLFTLSLELMTGKPEFSEFKNQVKLAQDTAEISALILENFKTNKNFQEQYVISLITAYLIFNLSVAMHAKPVKNNFSNLKNL